MEIYEYLSQFREETPRWLSEYKPSEKVSFRDIMSSRIAYYPGFGKDGTLLKVGNMSHSVHSFIHLDYLNTREVDTHQIDALPGYHRIGHVDWELEDLLPNGAYPFNGFTNKKNLEIRARFCRNSDHHIMTDIMQRDAHKDETYGAERIALTVVCGDGIEFYYQLFVKEYSKTVWLFLLQDHGFGCNYDRFGYGGALHNIMRTFNVWPEFIITDNKYGTKIYDDYALINGLKSIVGGMHHNVRYLFRHINNH